MGHARTLVLLGVALLALPGSAAFAKSPKGIVSLYASERPYGSQLDQLADGRLVVAGTLRRKRDDLVTILRFSARGKQDRRYGNAGAATNKVGNGLFSRIRTLLLDRSGAAVVSGSFSLSDTQSIAAATRFTASGAVDRAFGDSGSISWADETESPLHPGAERYDPESPMLVPQQGGPPLWLGNSLGGGGQYPPSGCAFALSASFGRASADSCLYMRTHPEHAGNQRELGFDFVKDRQAAAGFEHEFKDALADPAGGAVAALGGTDAAANRPLFGIARVDSSGAIDRAFGDYGLNNGPDFGQISSAKVRVTTGATSIAPRRGGGWVVGGTAPTAWGLAGYTAGGQVDPSFGTGGKLALDPDPTPDPDVLTRLVPLRDGRILVIGCNFGGKSVPSGFLAMIHSDGSLDRGFGTRGMLVIKARMLGTNEIYELTDAVEQKDGKLAMLATGWNTRKETTSLLLFRLKPNGALDRSFGR